MGHSGAFSASLPAIHRSISRCRKPCGGTRMEGVHQCRWLHVKIREGILSFVGSPAPDQRTMRYASNWIPLSEARGMLESSGHSRDEAEYDICKAIADRKIKIRYKILQVFGTRGLPLPAPALRIPSQIVPQ